jgi:hypothetical protein
MKLKDNTMTENIMLKKISEETMRFMRGKYALDEIGNGKDELTFCENGEVIFSIKIHEDHYKFHVGDKCVSVLDMETLETAKTLILEKKKPNRKPFSKENAVYADCGHRCDLCVFFTGNTFTDEFRMEINKRIERAFNIEPKDGGTLPQPMLCDGCHKGGLSKSFDCHQMKCAAQNGFDKCVNCNEHPCDKAHVGLQPEIHTRTIFAEDVTWAVLPFVHEQYGN